MHPSGANPIAFFSPSTSPSADVAPVLPTDCGILRFSDNCWLSHVFSRRSKHVLQSKLNLPLRSRLRLKSSARYRPECRTRRLRVRDKQIRMIRQIENLAPELQRLVLRDSERPG